VLERLEELEAKVEELEELHEAAIKQLCERNGLTPPGIVKFMV
jgi:hypothetical protein